MKKIQSSIKYRRLVILVREIDKGIKMKKLIIAGFAFVGIILFTIIAALFTGFSVQKDSEGYSKVSLFWGAIKVDERDKRVRIFGDFVDVDGLNNKVKVSDIVDVDGGAQIVNIDNGTIIVDGKENLVKIKKELVSKVEENKIFIRNHFNSSKLGALVALGKDQDEIYMEGNKIGEDETYIHVQTKDKEITVDIKVEM